MKLFTLKTLVLLIVAWWLWKNVVSDWIDVSWNLPLLGAGSIENYGDMHLHYDNWTQQAMHDCEPQYSAAKECTQTANAQCGSSTDRLNGCWMPAYLKCSVSSAITGQNTNCYTYANAYCGGAPGECADCFSKAHQQCMAAKGLPTGC